MKATEKTRSLPATLLVLALTAAWTTQAAAQLLLPPPPAPTPTGDSTEPAPAPQLPPPLPPGPKPLTVAERLARLSSTVSELSVSNKGIKNSLQVKVDDASAANASGETALTLSHLKAFTSHASAQSGKHLTAAQASDLVSQAGVIVSCLTNSD